MAKYNLEDEQYQKEPPFILHEGDKVLAVIGWQHANIPDRNVINAECRVLRDLAEPVPEDDPETDEGMTVRLTIWDPKPTDKGHPDIVKLAKALGFNGELDDEDETQLDEVLPMATFIGTVRNTTKQTEDGTKIYSGVKAGSLRAYEGPDDPDWTDLRNEAGEAFVAMMDAKEAQESSGSSSYKSNADDPF